MTRHPDAMDTPEDCCEAVSNPSLLHLCFQQVLGPSLYDMCELALHVQLAMTYCLLSALCISLKCNES